MFEPGACPGIGERLFVNKHGEGVCGCDDGWGEGDDGICYQEFTQGFCQENTIVRINKKRCHAQTRDDNFKDCIFPFVHNDTLYTGCAEQDWPQTLSEEVEGTPWCPTALHPNLTLKGDDWGLCSDHCPLDKGKDAFVYEDELSMRMLRLLNTSSTGIMECKDNPCGDPRSSLPHM